MHICICICTYKRPELLKRLLSAADQQDTRGFFSFSLVIADNDAQKSAKELVEDFAVSSLLDITYCFEPRKSISHARNKALEYANGDAIAFIDDDEFPPKDWLYLMVNTLNKYKVAGVFGPVKPHFDSKPPNWIVKGRFFDRPEHQTGFIMPWSECRTGNVLILKDIIVGMETVFNPDFGAGASDIELFRRLIDAGHKFVWCNEAFVYEVVPPNRWKRSFMIKRALLRGRISLLHRKNRVRGILKSFLAVPAYLILLPLLQIIGHHLFMIYMIKLCDHSGKLLALIGLNPIKEREM
ncbi:MAG: glycosyltransferase family 2 protein [Calditrichaceae bacterium]|nr:glycosyltransferase [Calditrichia bacterium]NUQ43371.1 glycosyltransferase family 2 protein [Calditrichaceae bacterium]